MATNVATTLRSPGDTTAGPYGGVADTGHPVPTPAGGAATQAKALSPTSNVRVGAQIPVGQAAQQPGQTLGRRSLEERKELNRLRKQATASGTPWDPFAALAKMRSGTAGASGAAPAGGAPQAMPPVVPQPAGLAPTAQTQAQALSGPVVPNPFWS